MTHDTAGLVTRALTKTYMRGHTPVHALAGVDLTLPQGTQVAIMGPSGSGKTTLLHCLAGVLRPSSGSITLDGEEMTTMSERVLSNLRLRRFGFVFQDGQLLPELPTEENIAMPLMLAGTPKSQAISRAREILANLGLDGAGPYRPGQLSGGQAQRVAIGRALATDPSVIFADEPTGALDQATGGEVMSLLTSACASTGASLVLVTHDPEEAFTLADRIALMHAGRVLQYGAPRDLLQHPADAQAARLLGLQNVSEERYIPPQAITVCAASSDSSAEGRIVRITDLPEARRLIFVHRRYGELTADLDRQQAGWLDSLPDNGRIGVAIDDRQIVRFAGQASTGGGAV